MFGFGYALVPIYRAICDALGINVLSLSELQTGAGAGRRPTARSMPAARSPSSSTPTPAGRGTSSRRRRSIEVHPGEIATVMYEFRNRQNRTMAAQAIPSYAPTLAMSHFNKLECFCFSEHVLKPGESKQWPVVFVVDAKLPKDVKTITLSYTFFEVGGKVPAEPAQAVRLDTPAAAAGRS